MTDEIVRTLRCVNCRKEYPPGTSGVCPDDQGELLGDPLVGTSFAGKYEVLSLLGEGGMSRVYKARHIYMNRIVAIKLLYDCARDSVAKARFQQEAEAASALSHPNVVTVHDFGLTDEGQPYFIMDCLEGESLADILETNRCLRIQQAIEVFSQACEGLDHAHRKGIIHRDVKPSNLVIIKQDDGHDLVKLVDFGIAKLVTPSDKNKQKRITQTGEVFGTPAYMSPEQCNGRALDARSDIYSLGCLMYESLAGEPPLTGDTFVSTVVKHVSEQPALLSEKALVKVPPAVETVIMKCLEKDPLKRFNSAAELKQALLDAAFESGLKGLRVGAVREPRALSISGLTSQSGISQTGEAAKRRHSLHLLVSGLLGLLVLFAGSWYLFFCPGPEGDAGTFFDKLRWQFGVVRAENLAREQKYGEAVGVLERSVSFCRKFSDDGRRLQFTLNKLVDAYAANHDSEKVEYVNNQLAALDDRRLYAEYDSLMARLSAWHQPSNSRVKWEERAQQAAAFAERISRCADKLAGHSKQKQEDLLKYAARTYDILNLREGIYRSSFRIRLSQIYRSEKRANDEQAVLQEAFQHSAENPVTAMGWSNKIRISLFLGELYSARGEPAKARPQLDNALSWTQAHLAGDHELLRQCLISSAHLYDSYHTAEYAQKAALLSQEARKISDSMNVDAPGPKSKTK